MNLLPDDIVAEEASELPAHHGGLWLPGGMLSIMTNIDREGRTEMQMQQGWAFLPVPRTPPLTMGMLTHEHEEDEAPTPGAGPGTYL